VSGEITMRIMQATTRFSQTRSGILPSVIPSQRRHRTVATTLTAVPIDPMPLTRRLSVQ
jgi:hypothetical protein